MPASFSAQEGASQKRTQWLVDLENVGRKWRYAADTAVPGDIVHLFFSDKSVKIGIDELGGASAQGVQFQFHECSNGLPNAMDFQIMCALGMLAVASPKDGYVLFTRDKGFSSVLEYMQERGYDVQCAYYEDPCELQPAAQQCSDTWRAYQDIMVQECGLSEQDAAAMAGILEATMSKPANKRKLACRNRMIKQWGNSDGSLMYQAMKDVIHKIANEGPYPAQPVRQAAAKLSSANVINAMSQYKGMAVTGKFAAVLCSMVQSSNTTSNPAQSLRDKLMQHYKNAPNADKAFRALEQFLKV